MFVIIYGKSGSGKTSSFIPEPNIPNPIKGFKPEELLIITATNKPLAGTFGHIYMNKKRVITAKNMTHLYDILKKLDSSEAVKSLKALVIDDFNLLQTKTIEKDVSPNKFDMYDNLGSASIRVIELLDSMSARHKGLIPFLLIHEDDNGDIKLTGKKLQSHFDPAGLCNHVFNARKEVSIDDSVNYFFTTKYGSISKAPPSFFKEGEDYTIPNDSRIIYDRIMNPPKAASEDELNRFFQ